MRFHCSVLCLLFVSYVTFVNGYQESKYENAVGTFQRRKRDLYTDVMLGREDTDHLLRRTKRASYSSIKAKLQKALRTKSIPDEMTKIVSAIVKAVDIDKCIPTVKKGNCYTSKTFCDVKTKEFNTAIKLTICKKPWSLKIDFKIPKDFKSKVPRILKPFLYVDVKPIVLKLDHKKTEGITKVRHNARIATAGLKILFIKLKYIKVYFIFELTVRWDCTRPRSDHLKRLKYNRDYSDGKKGNDMNKHYYKLKIRYEIKQRKPFRIKYTCKKCKTILNKKGHLTYGPKKCKSDWSAWSPSSCSFVMQCSAMKRRRTCVGQSTGGPRCSGSSTKGCGIPSGGGGQYCP